MGKCSGYTILPLCVGAVMLLAGCASGPSNSLFPAGHRLTDEAKALRAANPPPLEIPRELEKQPLPTYTVEPGDVLLVQPANLDAPVQLPADQPILADGTINLGKYGLLQVAGKTVPEIEALVLAAVTAQTKDPGFITVRLVARVSKVYYVIGEVNSPGAFPLQGRETVLDGIMQAGGLTANGSRENIILSRPTRPNCPRVVLPVCWSNIVQLGDTATNYQLAPGDRIYVPSRTCRETVPLVHRQARTSPCCAPQVPLLLPPYPANCWCDAPSPFPDGVTSTSTIEERHAPDAPPSIPVLPELPK